MQETAPLLDDSQTGGQSATTKVPEVEIHLFLTGRGLDPIHVFKWNLGGEEQNQLEVGPILVKYGLKTIFAFTVDYGRGVCVPIKFNPRNGRSLLTYRDGTLVHIIAEPENPVSKTIQRIVIGAVFATLLNTFLVRHPPAWIKNNFSIQDLPMWVLVCIMIVLIILRKRSRDIYRKFGWCH
ncbi:unnamed protein product [Eruca vesicaria subsp. sativa]|uniref:Uncharacterized protein n=1 Tax=Eruca vesicaria subsp. sativa TaxID=29727 RepID=A0ABC8KJK7_ERUVS|nr:unnamed protein product [Eruca vesicaria subsp. sativa]